MNPWQVFQTLIPRSPMQAAEVIAHETGGRSRVELPTGEQILVFGQDVTAGNWCYIRDGRVQGPAPNLAVVEVEV